MARKQKMDDETLHAAVAEAIEDAVDYVDDDLAPVRTKALQYYRGDAFGNEETGRSQVVMTEVRDTILAMLPSLIRIFTASEKPVEFAPRRQDAIEYAEQATDYVSYVFMVDNPGFQLLHSAVKDALLFKTGVFKWGTEERTEVRTENYAGVPEMKVPLLLEDPELEIDDINVVGAGELDPMSGKPTGIYDVKATRKTRVKRQFVVTLPPEEFLITRGARDIDSARFVGHRSLKTLSELVDMGYEAEEITEHGGVSASFELNYEKDEREGEISTFKSQTSSKDESQNTYLYIEGYMRVDRDGDGVAELLRICTIGDKYHVLHEEVADYAPFAVLCPDPTPHLVVGQSIADQVMDLQLIKSNIVRNTLDSLAQTIHPRTGVVEGQVNMDDVLNTENGGVIRMLQPGMVQPLSEPFIGQQALPILAYLDDTRASRTGMSKASQGLDPDVLQSTTKAAVSATVSAAQERLDMVARIFAEGGVKRLFRGLLKEVIKNADQTRIVRLRNAWVPVDPKHWDADMDVVVNVGLGTGNAAEKTQLLGMVAQTQQQIIQTLGPDNPLCDLKQLRDNYVRVLALNGIKDGSRFFKEVTPEAVEQFKQQQAAAAEQANPAAMLAKVEAAKIQKDMQIAERKAELDEIKTMLDDDRERDKIEGELYLKALEIQAKYGAQIQIEQLYGLIERQRNDQRTALELYKENQRSKLAEAQAAQAAQAAQMQQQEALPPPDAAIM
jgi:hypothetical protein